MRLVLSDFIDPFHNMEKAVRCRHVDTRQKATIRFVGQIKGAEFYGIEYDQPGFGKYNGMYDGVKYFECPEEMGAFVKAKKLEFGVDLYESVQQKYLLDRKAEKVMTLTDGQMTKDLEFCGMEQVDHWHRQVERMPVIGFQDGNVGSIFDPVKLSTLIPGCVSLDLSDTLINSPDAVLLFSLLPNLRELILSRNAGILLSKLTQTQVDTLAQIKDRELRLFLNSIPGQTQEDINVLTRIPAITYAEFNEAQVNANQLAPNVSLKGLSVTGMSLRFKSLAELHHKLLRKFPALEELTAGDALREDFETPTPDLRGVEVPTQLRILNLQDSALAFDSLEYLRTLCPALKSLKILKLFHSKRQPIRSIFQADQVVPIVGGALCDSIVSVNAMEVKKKNLEDFCLFYLRYTSKLEDFVIAESPLFLRLAKLYKYACLRRICLGLSAEQLNELVIEAEETDENLQEKHTRSQEIGERYRQRMMEIRVEKTGSTLLLPKATPAWKLTAMLKSHDVQVEQAAMVMEDGREIPLSQIRFSALLEEFREFYCVIK